MQMSRLHLSAPFVGQTPQALASKLEEVVTQLVFTLCQLAAPAWGRLAPSAESPCHLYPVPPGVGVYALCWREGRQLNSK